MSQFSYSRWDRLLDRLHGFRDGRRGLPEIPANIDVIEVPKAKLATAYMLALAERHAAFVAGAHRRANSEDQMPNGSEATALTARIEHLTRLVVELKERLEKNRGPDLAAPASQRERFLGMDTEGIEADRRRTFEQRRAATERQLMVAQQELTESQAALVRGEQSAEQHKVRAEKLLQAEVDGHAAHTRERLLVYLGALVRWHPGGKLLHWSAARVNEITEDAVLSMGSRLGQPDGEARRELAADRTGRELPSSTGQSPQTADDPPAVDDSAEARNAAAEDSSSSVDDRTQEQRP